MKTLQDNINELYQETNENDAIELFEQGLEEGKIGHMINGLLTFVPSGLVWLLPFLKTISMGWMASSSATLAGSAWGGGIAGIGGTEYAVGAGVGATIFGGIGIPAGLGIIILGLGVTVALGIVSKDIVMRIIRMIKNKQAEKAMESLLKNKQFMADAKKLNIDPQNPGTDERKAVQKLANKYLKAD